MCSVMASANSEGFTFSFPIWILLCFLSVSSTMVVWRSGDGGHPSLVPHLRETAQRFSAQGMGLAVGLSYLAFIMLKCVPSPPTL